jgi:hypothetical protein
VLERDAEHLWGPAEQVLPEVLERDAEHLWGPAEQVLPEESEQVFEYYGSDPPEREPSDFLAAHPWV